MESKENIVALTSIRFFLSLLVVIYHTQLYLVAVLFPTTSSLNTYFNFGQTAVDAFFFLADLFFRINTFKHLKKYLYIGT
ncbi:Uncharacterised protein [BD1-7 clade bacterium]|uniref:Acyltransferase 3 domain-containing protein n=1 Tax=BD1-7 clade bacterium TaxID=2029982 RepID=A0A5S9PYZ8_9GAMM|nr:Uncharacterised protein [BD1-7 clade bacterium]CAA0109955.1 Uncharacterised protein [BD1-7 clade bacterium]CAA0116630.1 Uncharacterised protein [BD1-7 clade bacterium]